LDMVVQVNAVFGHSWLVWMLQTDMALVLLDPGLNRMVTLPDVDLTTLTWHAAHAWSWVPIYLSQAKETGNLLGGGPQTWCCAWTAGCWWAKRSCSQRAGRWLRQVSSGLVWLSLVDCEGFPSQRDLALSTSMESTACLLEGWGWELELRPRRGY
jgi:hypothetical protein